MSKQHIAIDGALRCADCSALIDPKRDHTCTEQVRRMNGYQDVSNWRFTENGITLHYWRNAWWRVEFYGIAPNQYRHTEVYR